MTNENIQPPERSFDDIMTTQEILEAMAPQYAEKVDVARLQATRDAYKQRAATGLGIMASLMASLVNGSPQQRSAAIERAQTYIDECLMEEEL